MLRFARTLPVPFIPLFVQQFRGAIEGSAATTGLVSSLNGAATALAGVTLTRLVGRYRKIGVITMLLVAAMLVSVPIFFLPDLWMFVIASVVFTYFLGGVEPIIQASLSERTPSKKRGLLFGINTTVSNAGWFLAPLLGSAVSIHLSIRHIYLTTTIFLGLMAMTGFTLMRSRRVQVT